jgi:hypothetical protein
MGTLDGRRPVGSTGVTGRSATITLVGLLAAGAFACRDAPAPFDADVRGGPLTGTARLTFSPGDEHAPAWTSDGARLVYASDGFAPFPLTDGLLLSIPATGGEAELALPGVQQGTFNPGVLAVPAVSRVDGSVAYLRILRVLSRDSCADGFAFVCDGAFESAVPMVLFARLMVRVPGSGADPEADPSLEVEPEGFRHVPPPAPVELRIIHRYPYQRSFREEGIHALRPSWHPSERRLVFSDGLRLLTWSPGSQPSPVPATDHGFAPAWSPTGEWIAYTREVPTDSQTVTCTQSSVFGVFCRVEEHLYTTPGPSVALVRPDGSDGRTLAVGSQPAFSADGSRVYYVAADGIRSVDLNGANDSLVPGTEGGREPAVSPDGTRLAFSRALSGGFDLWITPLP